jgi:hypothetical protein
MHEQMASFPDDRSLAFLRSRHVTYLVVRAGLFEPEERAALLQQLNQRRDLSLEAMWPDGPQGAEAMYVLSGNASPDVVIPVRTPHTVTTMTHAKILSAIAACASLTLTACTAEAPAPLGGNEQASKAAHVTRAPFGTMTDGTSVEIFTLTSANGMEVRTMPLRRHCGVAARPGPQRPARRCRARLRHLR